MKKFLISVICTLSVYTAMAESGSMTTQSYVDTLFGTKMDKLPPEYTQLEYLESTGEQYIGTGITADTSIIIDTRVWHSNNNLPTNNKPQTVIGTRTDSIYDTNVFQFGFINGLHFFNRYGLGSINGDTFTPNTWYDVHLENRNCTIQGDFNYRHNYEFKQNMNTQGTLYLFATNDSVQGRIFELIGRIGQKGGSVVRNFIPARRNSDGELGMYDTVTNTFFTNSGNGDFTAGPDVI